MWCQWPADPCQFWNRFVSAGGQVQKKPANGGLCIGSMYRSLTDEHFFAEYGTVSNDTDAVHTGSGVVQHDIHT